MRILLDENARPAMYSRSCFDLFIIVTVIEALGSRFLGDGLKLLGLDLKLKLINDGFPFGFPGEVPPSTLALIYSSHLGKTYRSRAPCFRLPFPTPCQCPLHIISCKLRMTSSPAENNPLPRENVERVVESMVKGGPSQRVQFAKGMERRYEWGRKGTFLSRTYLAIVCPGAFSFVTIG